MNEEIPIQSRDYWFKVVEMLQQNWALIEPSAEGVIVQFISDTSGVFDAMKFTSEADAASALLYNGFKRFAEDEQASSFLAPPSPPFHMSPHPNGPIYSSGQYWQDAP